MRYETRTVRIGEKLGPINWDYDFAAHGWDRGHGGGLNPNIIESRVEALRRCEAGECEATTDGGWPRVGWGRVLDTGMWDGWPYWRPVPSVLIQSHSGAEWHPWCSITEVRAL